MKLTTNKIKELIPSWFDLNNPVYNKLFTNFFGDIDLLPEECIKYCKVLKCGKSKSEMISALKIFIADGKNWKRYEKAKFSLEEYNEEQNGQKELMG